MRWLDGITDLMDEFWQRWEMMKDGEAGPDEVCGVAKSWTQLKDNKYRIK